MSVKKTAEEKPVEKKAAAKKADVKVALFVEYEGGQKNVDDIIAMAKEAAGKNSLKELNIYYQPENHKVYFTADGVEGQFDFQ